jgi:hypothetical protein
MNNKEYEIEVKKCIKCKEFKPLISFSKDKSRKDGLTNYCKICKNSLDKKWIKNNPESNKQSRKKYYINNKDTILDKAKNYNQNNKEKRKEYNKLNRTKDKLYLRDYNKLNKTHIQNNRKKYNKLNRDKINKYQNKRYDENLNHKLGSLIRSRIFNAIKSNSKSKKTIKMLGCDIKQFKHYLEQQFLPEMSWDNHGTIWEIDHIIPCAKFDLTIEENIFKCFHYTNHQPLFKTTEIAELFGYKNQIGNRNKQNKII